MSFRYSTGMYHPAPDRVFHSLQDIWSETNWLRSVERLGDVVCCNEDGDILDAPYNETMIPGIVEEKIEGHSEPRRWILQS